MTDNQDLTVSELEALLEAEFQSEIEVLRATKSEQKIKQAIPLLRKMRPGVSYFLNAKDALQNRYFILTELVMMEFDKRDYHFALEHVFQNALRGEYPTLKDLYEKNPEYGNWRLAGLINQCAASSAESLIFKGKNWEKPAESDDSIRQQARAYFEKEKQV